MQNVIRTRLLTIAFYKKTKENETTNHFTTPCSSHFTGLQ